MTGVGHGTQMSEMDYTTTQLAVQILGGTIDSTIRPPPKMMNPVLDNTRKSRDWSVTQSRLREGHTPRSCQLYFLEQDSLCSPSFARSVALQSKMASTDMLTLLFWRRKKASGQGQVRSGQPSHASYDDAISTS